MALTQCWCTLDASGRVPGPGGSEVQQPRLAGARVLVVGMGRTGLAAARFLASRGADVLLADTRDEAELGEKWTDAQQLGVATRPGLKDARSAGAFDLAVISPGLPLDSPAVAGLQTPEIVGELELASWFCTAPIIAVAGTNGKGTTSTLLGDMLAKAGRPTVVAGNIGSPLIENIERIQDSSYAVVEVSSFQLEGIKRFRPWIAVLLNITPDHLDYHTSFENYVAAKARLFRNQTADDYAVLNADDANVARAAGGGRARRVLFTLSADPSVGAFVADDRVMVRTRPEAEARAVCAVADVPVAGRHNVANVLAAALAASLCGASPPAVGDAVRAYRPPEHSLERVAVMGGVTFINDTKATNAAAAMAALDAVAEPAILIAGGKDKGVDLSGFAALAAKKARAVFLIGETAEAIAEGLSAAGGPTPVLCGSLEQAVERSAEVARPGEIVLLAPACSSHDMFVDYADRGRRFKAAVRKLTTVGGRS